MNWRSLHVHYHHPQDALLVDALAPLVARLRSQGLARWFFLRYWKHGPHVRLRLLLPDEEEHAALREAQTRIGDYFARHPSATAPQARLDASQRMLAELEGLGDDGDTHMILADNTLWPQPYDPEYDKYGGPAGIALAETLFEHSSDVALETLSVIGQAASRRLGLGFGMMIAGLRGAALSASDVVDFLAFYFRFWSRYVSDDLATTWRHGLAERAAALRPYAEAILSDQGGESRTGAALARWRDSVRDAMAALDARAADVLPAVTLLGADASWLRRRQFILFNFLHTHNNRLGVMPVHEAYVAYLGHHIISCLAGIAPQHLLINPARPADS